MPNYKDFDLDVQKNEENNNDVINYNTIKATGTWRLCCLPPTTTLV